MNLKVYNMKKEEVGNLELNDMVFGADYNQPLIHQVIVALHNNARQGTKSTLTRSEINASKKKMYRQKGTGNARHDEKSAPQFTGGGVVFAPKPRDYSFKLNKKVKRLALKSALTTKVSDNKFIVLDELKLDQIKTKEMIKVLNALNVQKALVVMANDDKNVVLSARNISGVETASVNTINTYDLLKYDTCVVTKEAVQKIEEVYA